MIHIRVLGEPGNEAILIMQFCVKMQNLTPTVSNNAFTQWTLIFNCCIIQMPCHIHKHETSVMLKIGKHNCSRHLFSMPEDISGEGPATSI